MEIYSDISDRPDRSAFSSALLLSAPLPWSAGLDNSRLSHLYWKYVLRNLLICLSVLTSLCCIDMKSVSYNTFLWRPGIGLYISREEKK